MKSLRAIAVLAAFIGFMFATQANAATFSTSFQKPGWPYACNTALVEFSNNQCNRKVMTYRATWTISNQNTYPALYTWWHMACSVATQCYGVTIEWPLQAWWTTNWANRQINQQIIPCGPYDGTWSQAGEFGMGGAMYVAFGLEDLARGWSDDFSDTNCQNNPI